MIWLLGSFLGFTVLGVPLGLAMLLAGILYVATVPGIGFVIVPQQLQAGLDSFPLLAVPFFVLAGALMVEAGVTERLVVLARTMIGHIRGGLAHSLVVAGMILAGCSGSGTADAAALGGVMIPAMREERYDTSFAVALSACAGAIGPIIPPSIIMIIYGAMGNVSVGQLFLGGAIPGILMGLYLMVASYMIARRRGYGPHTSRASMGEQLHALRRGALDVILPGIVIGGIVGGIFTPTEAGAIAVAYVLFIGGVVYRTLNLERILRACRESIVVLGSVMFIIAAAALIGYVLALLQAPDRIGEFFAGISSSPAVFLVLVNILLLVLGCVMEVTAILVLMTPILVPVLPKFGIDPVHFGVVMALNLTIGLLTPPVGLAMYVTCAIGNVGIEDYTRACWPFLLVLVALLALITAAPDLVLWLPRMVMRG
jgi:tripartite ATP-independent transporter DctM subunit